MPLVSLIRHHRTPLVTAAAAAAFVVLATGGTDMAALQKMAGYANKNSLFADVEKYLENLRDSLIPLAIPLGGIGVFGGGAAYMVGNVMAQRILGGVIIGVALALMGPSLVA